MFAYIVVVKVGPDVGIGGASLGSGDLRSPGDSSSRLNSLAPAVTSNFSLMNPSLKAHVTRAAIEQDKIKKSGFIDTVVLSNFWAENQFKIFYISIQ